MEEGKSDRSREWRARLRKRNGDYFIEAPGNVPSVEKSITCISGAGIMV